MTTKSLRVALIGAGMMGKSHARVIREIDGAELVVIADANGDPHRIAGDTPVVANTQAVLNHDVDCAIVAIPTVFHEETAVALAEAHIPTLVEKPISNTVESGQRIQKAFSQTNTLAVVGHIERFNPAVVELSRRLQLDELGQIFQIATRRQSSFPKRISDVGVGLDLATHDVDLAMFIGQSPYQTVSAFFSQLSGRDSEDMIVASGMLANGLIVNHVVNWMSPLKERSIVVSGEGGIFIADTSTGDLTMYRNGEFDIDWDSLATFRGISEGEVTRFSYQKKEPLRAELEAFFGAVSGGSVLDMPSPEDGVRAVRVVQGMAESARAKSSVHFDHL